MTTETKSLFNNTMYITLKSWTEGDISKGTTYMGVKNILPAAKNIYQIINKLIDFLIANDIVKPLNKEYAIEDL
jgi:hypothetical protein